MHRLAFIVKLQAQFKDANGAVVASVPELDVVTQGKDRTEARQNLIEAIQLFLESCYERGVLDEVLMSCGFRPAHGVDQGPFAVLREALRRVFHPGRSEECLEVPLHLVAAKARHAAIANG